MYAFCFSCPSATFALQLGGFVPRRMASCKGPICRIDVLCCVVSWFKLKYKVKIKLQKYCERKRNTATMKYSKRMDNALTFFWCKTSDRKRDTPDGKLLLSALEETTLE